MLYKRLIWLIWRHLCTPALIYFKSILHFLTFQTSKLYDTIFMVFTPWEIPPIYEMFGHYWFKYDDSIALYFESQIMIHLSTLSHKKILIRILASWGVMKPCWLSGPGLLYQVSRQLRRSLPMTPQSVDRK